ncbi:hypothetical protein ACHAWO_005060 [Cyclotella atomus]|uniref:Uncharacterized protein n=1 Tax=Cyclotella atomus TaxID=382360 RepID=A0ABD3NB49_9STRA
MLPPPPLPQVQFQPRSDDKRNNDAYEESKNEQEDNTSFGDGGEFSPIQGEQGGADSIQNGGMGQFDEILVESAVNYMLPPPPLPQVQFQPRLDDKRNNDAYEESKNEQEDNTSFGDGGEFSPIQGEQGGADSIQNGGVGQFDEILVKSAVNYTFP